ncbi:MAG: hypothetical protein QXG05_01060 [Nitrososphaerota archaeon]
MYGNRFVWITIGVLLLAVDAYLIAKGLPYAAKGMLLFGEMTTIILGILLLFGLFFVSYGALAEPKTATKSGKSIERISVALN